MAATPITVVTSRKIDWLGNRPNAAPVLVTWVSRTHVSCGADCPGKSVARMAPLVSWSRTKTATAMAKKGISRRRRLRIPGRWVLDCDTGGEYIPLLGADSSVAQRYAGIKATPALAAGRR